MEAQVFKVLVHNFFKWNEPMSWLAWAIRKATGKEFNHAGLVVTLSNRKYLIHAVYPRVAIQAFDKWKKEKPRKLELTEVFGDIEAIQGKAIEQIGKRYDWPSLLIYMPIYLLTGGRVWLGKKETKAGGKLYCYELVSYVLDEDNSHKVLPYKRMI